MWERRFDGRNRCCAFCTISMPTMKPATTNCNELLAYPKNISEPLIQNLIVTLSSPEEEKEKLDKYIKKVWWTTLLDMVIFICQFELSKSSNVLKFNIQRLIFIVNSIKCLDSCGLLNRSNCNSSAWNFEMCWTKLHLKKHNSTNSTHSKVISEHIPSHFNKHFQLWAYHETLKCLLACWDISEI